MLHVLVCSVTGVTCSIVCSVTGVACSIVCSVTGDSHSDECRYRRLGDVACAIGDATSDELLVAHL